MEIETHSTMMLKSDKQVTDMVQKFCLIGKILLNIPLNKYVVKSVTNEEWKCRRDFSVSYIKNNMFMFSFEDQYDFQKVINNTPWSVNRGLLIFSPWISSKVPEELQFSYSPFWVQVHGLPLNYLIEENGVNIGRLFRNIVGVDRNVIDGKIDCRKFLRIRVIVDVRIPLLTGFWLKRDGLPDIWIDFKYEKLAQFCYKCGRIGNEYITCKFPPGSAKFGPWLRGIWVDVVPFNHPSGGTEPRTAARRGMTGCTSLVIVPQSKAIMEQSSMLEICPEMEPGGIVHHAAVDLPKRYLWQKLIINSMDSVAMAMNSLIISHRVGHANAYYDQWRLLVMMVGYFFYLMLKFGRQIRRCQYFNQGKIKIPLAELGKNALLEIFILIIFLVTLSG